MFEDLGRPQPGVEDITLELAESLWLLNLRAIGINDGIAGVLPTHVLVAPRGPSLVLLKAVAIEIAVAVDPLEAPDRDVAELSENVIITHPFPCLVEEDEEERGRVGGPVIRRVGHA